MDTLDEETKDGIVREIGALFPSVSDLSFFRLIFDNENWDLEKSVQTIKSLLEDFDVGSSSNASSIKNDFETGASSQNSTPLEKIVPSAPPQPEPAPFTTYTSAVKNSWGKAGAIPKASNSPKDAVKSSAYKGGRKEKLIKVYNNALKQGNQIHRITSFTLEGIKVMIIMRGCPGSGKTFLVNNLATNLSIELSKSLNSPNPWPVRHHIFSADDFWVNPRNGKYIFDSEYIEYAHLWNQKLVRQAASEGRSPLFIDNTHTRMWEMKAYAALAVEFGYVIEIIESPNKWAFSENELVRRNVHGVHRDAIRRMLDRYEHHITPSKLLANNRLSYHHSVTPPQRCLVSFNTPPSKNQLKTFNSSFHCVSLDVIRSLKSGVNTFNDSHVQLTKSSYFNTNSNSNNNIPVKLVKDEVQDSFKLGYDQDKGFVNSRNGPLTTNYTLQELISSQNPINQVPILQPSKEPQNANIQSIDYFWKLPAQPESAKNNLTNQQQNHSTDSSLPSADNSSIAQQDINTRSINFFWDMPAHSVKPNGLNNQTHNSSVDSLLPLAQKTLNTLIDRVPPQSSSEIGDQLSGVFQSKPEDIDHRGNLNSDHSDSSVDLLSFENIEAPNVSSGSFDRSEAKPDALIEPTKSIQNLVADYCSSLSSSEEVFSDGSGESTSEESPYEVISPPITTEVCNEFGEFLTQEYVLIQPCGLVVYQFSHENSPSTLEDFVESSPLLSVRRKHKRLVNSKNGDGNASRRSLGGNLLTTVNKFIHLPHLKSKSRSYIDDMSASAPVSNDSAQYLNTQQNHELVSKSNVGGNVPVPIYQSENVPPDPLSGFPPSSSVSSSFVSNLSSLTQYVMTSDKFGSGLANTAESLNEVPVRESSERDDILKGQRAVSNRSCDISCNTNYVDFDILSRVNCGTFTGGAIVLVGRSETFQSSTLWQNFDCIKAVATHDKSSMTSSELPAIGKDSGMEILTKMFPEACTEGLAELFEKCQKDLDWTVNLMIDSGNQVSEHFVADEVLLQSCASDLSKAEYSKNDCEPWTTTECRKIKKSKNKLTKEYSDLVKEFEANFVLNEACYSERLKKVRETKFGKPDGYELLEDDQATRDSSPSNDPESSMSDSWEEDEGDMSLVMPNSLLSQLQSKFGPIPNLNGDDMLVKLPVCLARQIYSYALDSISQHMEDQQIIMDMLAKEDEEFSRKIQDEPTKPNGDVSFQEIMDYEMALRTQKRQSLSRTNEPTFASTLSYQLLTKRFPGMDPTTLKTVLDDTNQSLHQATNLLASAGHVPVDTSIPDSQYNLQDMQSEQQEDLEGCSVSKDDIIVQANAYREVALILNDLRQHYFLKVQESHNSGNHDVASFYRELVNWYTSQIKETNTKAAKMLLQGSKGSTTLDLHFLSVTEAVHLLDAFLDEAVRRLSTRKREIFLITGRGQHSVDGKSKIKPAIQQKLKQRGLKFNEVNPGMLRTVITKSSTISNNW